MQGIHSSYTTQGAEFMEIFALTYEDSKHVFSPLSWI